MLQGDTKNKKRNMKQIDTWFSLSARLCMKLVSMPSPERGRCLSANATAEELVVGNGMKD